MNSWNECKIGEIRKGGSTFRCDDPTVYDYNVNIIGGLPPCSDGYCPMMQSLVVNKEGTIGLVYENGKVVEVTVRHRTGKKS